MMDRTGPTDNDVSEIPSNQRTQEHDHKKAEQQKEDGGLEASKEEMEAGGVSTGRTQRTATAKGPQINSLPGNVQTFLNAWTQHNAEYPVHIGLGYYKNHPQLKWLGRCPLHNDRNPSFSVVLDLSTGWVLPKCQVCYPQDRIGRKSWVSKLCETLSLPPDALRPVPNWKPIRPTGTNPEPGVSPEDLEDRYNLLNQVYGHISRTTGLLPEHEQHLLNRGLTPEQIHRLGYFSIELVHHPRNPKDGYEDTTEFEGVPGVPKSVLSQLPGFSMKANRRKLKTRAGYPPDNPRKYLHFRPNKGKGIFIPARDTKGRIIGGQIRRFEEDKLGKYAWLKGGGSSVHIPLGFRPGEEVWITEGVLKADVSSCLEYPCIGVPGINCWKKVFPVLQELKPKRVVIAFDADQWKDGEPSQWIKDFIKALESGGIEVTVHGPRVKFVQEPTALWTSVSGVLVHRA